MTGRHSVMLSPDSVSRVRPPNTTIPNTLAAEPNSQYATESELVAGKEDVEAAFRADREVAPILRPSAPSGDVLGGAVVELCALDWRNAVRKGVWRVDLNVFVVAFACWLRHLLHTNVS